MSRCENEIRLGVISDTHDKLDSQIEKIFSEVDYIFHAGDIGDRGSVMMELETIAPVYAVRGNCDAGLNTVNIPYDLEIEISGIPIYMTHVYQCIDQVKAGNSRLVIYGHSHNPEINIHGETHYLNPGSASQRRRSKSCSVAIVRISQNEIDIDIVDL